MAIIDGIEAVLDNEKTPAELEKVICKKQGEEVFYLDKDREYRTEEDVFTAFTEEERAELFGQAPATVWENLTAFERYPEKTKIFEKGNVMPEIVLESYCAQILSQWKTELHDRIIPDTMNYIRSCKKLHNYDDFSDYDVMNWREIDEIRHEIAKDTITEKCYLTRAKDALDNGQYQEASDLQLEIQKKINKLANLYIKYKKNLL